MPSRCRLSLFTEHALVHLAHTYGPGLVGLVVALESMGLPLPAESLLLATAASLGAAGRGGIVWLLLAASAGAIIGDNIGYLIGHSLGWRALRRWGGHVGLSDDRLLLGRYLFRHYGGRVVFLGRFVVLVRTVAALLAGANRMGWRWFLLCNAAGGILWAGGYGVVAYLLGHAVAHFAAPVGIAIGLVALTALVAVFLAIRRNQQEWIEAAKRENGGGPRPEHSRGAERSQRRSPA